MSKLTNTQALILDAAARREGFIVLPLPASLRRGAVTNVVVASMLTKGLIEEVDADICKGAPVWRETGDGPGSTLVASDAGLAAIGIKPAGIEGENTGATQPPSADSATNTATPTRVHTPREGSKQARLIAMLRAPEGATVNEIAEAMGWQSHTVHGALSGALKKKLGLEITSEKVEGRGRVYRITS